MMINTIEEAQTFFTRIKEATVLNEVNRNDCILKTGSSGLDVKIAGSGTLSLSPDALSQYLSRTCGKAAPKAFNVFSSITGDDKKDWFQRGVDIINRKTSEAKGTLRLHVLDDKIIGVTSLKHVKVFDADILSTLTKAVGKTAEHFRASWTPNMSVFDWDLERFKDPSGLDWYFTVRFENNEFGRNAFGSSVLGVRQICTNGAVITSGSLASHRMIHVKSLTVEAVNKIIDLSVKGIEEVSQVIKKSFNTEILDYPKVWKMLRKKFKIRKADRPPIVKFIEQEIKQDTTYALGNALSAYANTFPGTDRYYQVQEAAGIVYSMTV